MFLIKLLGTRPYLMCDEVIDSVKSISYMDYAHLVLLVAASRTEFTINVALRQFVHLTYS